MLYPLPDVKKGVDLPHHGLKFHLVVFTKKLDSFKQG